MNLNSDQAIVLDAPGGPGIYCTSFRYSVYDRAGDSFKKKFLGGPTTGFSV